jgi:hypothetical protein
MFFKKGRGRCGCVYGNKWAVDRKSLGTTDLEQAWTTFYVVRETSEKFGVHAGNMKFVTQNEEWITIPTYNYMYNFTCLFYIYLVR